MKVLKWVLISIPILLAIALFGAWVWLQSFSPKLKGLVEVNGLKNSVNVYFDDFGIPHLYAKNADDAYRAFGYVHAQDRLFQMELMRRAGKGRLSEVLGPDMINADRFFRTMGTNRKVAVDIARFDSLPDEVKMTTRAYLTGVNEYIANGKLPVEFALIGIQPEPYDISDIYAIAAYMSYTFAYALRTDPIMQSISGSLGDEYLNMFSLQSDTLMHVNNPSPEIGFRLPQLIDQMPVPLLQGSNNWVVGPDRTASGKPILANDTHIKFTSPGAWYEAHIEYPGRGFYGNFLAGIPYPLVGHSRHHAWGVTMFENDDTDFFIEQFASSDSTSTVFGDTILPVIVHTETIMVKGQSDVVMKVYETAHGPLINEFLPVTYAEPVSFCWTYTRLKNELLEAFYNMNLAENMDEFRTNVAKVAAPGLNFAYADSSGNIALWSAARLPIRPIHATGKMYLRGYDPQDAWLGYLPFSANPQSENPASGYIYSANQLQPGEPYPGYYAPPTRAARIDSYLSAVSATSVDDMRRLLTDVVSVTEAAVAIEICGILTQNNYQLNPLEEAALEQLCAWDGNHQLDDIAPVIYYKVLYHTLHMAMADELSEKVFEDFLHTHELLGNYPNLISTVHSPWWDDISTAEVLETQDFIVQKAFMQSIEELNKQLGSDISLWQWKRVHSITHEHPFDKIGALRRWYNVGPFPAPGGHETVNNAGFTFNGTGIYRASFGPAMRIIIDFADVENAVSVLPSGNSGNVMSPFYRDQAHMFIEGRFRKMMMNEEEISNSKLLLVLSPE
jgi:penicillin amidase